MEWSSLRLVTNHISCSGTLAAVAHTATLLAEQTFAADNAAAALKLADQTFVVAEEAHTALELAEQRFVVAEEA